MPSQLPQIPSSRMNKNAGTTALLTRGNKRTGQIEVLQALAADPALPGEVRSKLQVIVDDLQDDRKKPTNNSSLTSTKCASGPSRAREVASSLVDGSAPFRHAVHSATTRSHVRAADFDVCASRFHQSRNSPRTFIKRSTPALQDPTETFNAMNKVLFETLQYIDEVSDMEFDISSVKESDGSTMIDRERLFLSVCCSVFANFNFCETLSLDLRKLVAFLGNIFNCYNDSNPFHTALHAADSLQMLSLFYREPVVNFLFTDEEILMSFLGVLAMDVAHPGMHSSSLAQINHTLVTVFGDIATEQQSGLLVFMHELLHDDNFFLADQAVGTQDLACARLLARESLYGIVLPSAPRLRPLLHNELHRVSAARCVRHDDIPLLMTALLVLSTNAFALRRGRQCMSGGVQLGLELRRETEELRKRNLLCFPPDIDMEEMQTFIPEYCSVVVKQVADAVKGLIPTDLYDNLERNVDAGSWKGELSFSLPSRYSHPDVSDQTSWTDTPHVVVDILKKAAAHANSLDRKASKRAILNASPPRNNNGGCGSSMDWRAGAVPILSLPSTGDGAALQLNLGASVIELESPRAASPIASPSIAVSGIGAANRSEHYFSFLRLYDKCENENEPFQQFSGQLLFLALQLDSRYIASYARDAFGSDPNCEKCGQMAAGIMANEEAPSTAEAIATHSPQTSGGSVQGGHNDDVTHTDGFLLYLMDMYSKREAAVLAALPSNDTVQSVGESSSATLPPSELGTPLAQYQPQPDSPIRLPINTDASTVFTDTVNFGV